MVIGLQYRNAYGFSEGLAAFRDGLAFVYESLDLPNARYGYIDKTGKVVKVTNK